MQSATESSRLAQDIERWIGSPARRALLAAGLTLTAALATTVQVSEALALRNREFELTQLYWQQLWVWLPWGLLGGPLVYLARAIFRWRRSWSVAALVQIPLSVLVAQGFQLYENMLVNLVFADTWLAPTRPAGTQTWFRFTRELLVYWLVLATGAAIYSFLKSQHEERNAAQARLREAKVATQFAQSQLDALRSQLNPHFLFNALHSVGGLVREQDSKRALQVLSSLGSLLRSTLEHGDVHEVRLVDELALVERYLEIERIRFGERLHYELDVDDAAVEARVPSLCLLTLVENSVRHGISKKEAGGRIVLRARVGGARLQIEIEDDGPGFPPELLEHGSHAPDARGQHIGLENTCRRLALLYGDAHTFRLANLPQGGATIVIELPLHPFPSPSLDEPAEVPRG